MVDVNADTVMKMQLKHPQAEPPVVPSVTVESPEWTLKEVRQALLSIPRNSAAGPSGLKPALVRQLVVAGGGEMVGAFAGLFARVEAGVPPEVSPWFFGARLVGLWKANGDIRPIASGEVVRRALAKGVVRRVVTRAFARRLLEGGQVAVGIRNGMDAAVVAVRRAAALARGRRDMDFVVAKLDRTNAFNTLDRGFMLRAVDKLAPGALPYAVAAYGQPSCLLFGGKRLWSSRGGQQGDPFMPLAYALAELLVAGRLLVAGVLLRRRGCRGRLCGSCPQQGGSQGASVVGAEGGSPPPIPLAAVHLLFCSGGVLRAHLRPDGGSAALRQSDAGHLGAGGRGSGGSRFVGCAAN